MNIRKAEKEKNILKYGVYENILLNICTSMFDFQNLPNTIPREKVMTELLWGRACFFETKGNYYILHGNYTGEPTEYNYADRFLASGCKNAYDLELSECEVVNLNNLGNNEYFNIVRFADLLTETELSQKTLIKIARSTEIVGVTDSKTIQVVKTAIKQRDNGEVGLITDTDTLSKIAGTDSIKSYQLSDPAQISNMVHLSQFSNELRKRYFMYLGLALNYNGKLAQQSELEVSENEAVAWVVPLMWFNNITEWVERVNTHYGLDIKVGFSNVWQIAYTKFKKSIEDNNNDNMMNDDDNVSRETLDTEGVVDNVG